VFSTLLIITGIVLLGLKLGLRAQMGIRLRELGRLLDRVVNLVLVVIVVTYCVQLTFIWFARR
jgi:hypothetical protein